MGGRAGSLRSVSVRAGAGCSARDCVDVGGVRRRRKTLLKKRKIDGAAGRRWQVETKKKQTRTKPRKVLGATWMVRRDTLLLTVRSVMKAADDGYASVCEDGSCAGLDSGDDETWLYAVATSQAVANQATGDRTNFRTE